MNYLEVFAYIANSPTLLSRSEVAIATAAVQVLAEATSVTNHLARAAWASKALEDRRGMARKMAWGIMANTTLQVSGDAMLDSDLQFTVNSLVDAFSALS
jgi:hypothetical protein